MEYRGLILKNIEELNKYNLSLINKEIPVKNNIKKILNTKALSTSDLSNMTGITRQHLSAIYSKKFKPGIDSVLKIAYVLNVSVEELFELQNSAWIKNIQDKNDETLYLDMFNLEIINVSTQKNRLKNDNIKYVEKELKPNRKLLTDSEYSIEFKKYFEENYITIKELLSKKHTKASNKHLDSLIKTTIEKQFKTIYIERFQKLVKHIFPIINTK